MTRMDDLHQRLQSIEKEILEELHSLREDRGYHLEGRRIRIQETIRKAPSGPPETCPHLPMGGPTPGLPGGSSDLGRRVPGSTPRSVRGDLPVHLFPGLRNSAGETEGLHGDGSATPALLELA